MATAPNYFVTSPYAGECLCDPPLTQITLYTESEENGVAEAASPLNENVGFMAYNALVGAMLTGKYMYVPAALDDADQSRATASLSNLWGRMDTRGWGGNALPVTHRRRPDGH